MTSIPVSVPSFPVLIDDQDDVLSADQNVPNTEITALATLVGMLGVAQSRSVDFLDFFRNSKPPILSKIDANSFSVSIGAVACSDSGQSIRVLRRNVASVTVTAANIDTGAMAVGLYYVYAVADAAATTFTIKFSLSATTPSSSSYYELIGWFYNESISILDITNNYISNVRGRGRAVPNSVTKAGATDISTASTSFVDMTNMVVEFYSSGGLCLVLFDAPFSISAGIITSFQITVDGVAVRATNHNFSSTSIFNESILYAGVLSAGLHEIKLQWKTASSTSVQNGATDGKRNLTVIEL